MTDMFADAIHAVPPWRSFAMPAARKTSAISVHTMRMGQVYSAEYTWPIRMVWTLMALVFLAAGIAKLRHGGTAWIASANMSVILLRSAYHTSDADPITTFGLWVASHAFLSRALAAAALVV